MDKGNLYANDILDYSTNGGIILMVRASCIRIYPRRHFSKLIFICGPEQS